MEGDIIELNVGGIPYTTTKQTLCRGAEPSSMLSAIVDSGLPSRRDANGRIFIDRDGLRFRAVLNYLRSAAFHCTQDIVALRELAEEAEFFGLEILAKKVHTELARIELEEDLGSMTAQVEGAKCAESVTRTSPSCTKAVDVFCSQDSSVSSDCLIPRREEPEALVARALDFGYASPAPSTAAAVASTGVTQKTTAKPEYCFTLDADF